MNHDKILRFANLFCAFAESEKLPENSKDLKTILNNIEKLETYNARKKYAEDNLSRISSGSSRIAYLTNDKTVIKLASNDRGIAQNKAELNSGKITSKFLNKILGNAKNFSWIHVNFLDKMTEKKFEEMTKLDFNDFGDCIRYSLSKNPGSKPKGYDKINKSLLFKEIVEIGEKLNLMSGDLAKISSYGVKDNHPVLIDVGLTKKVFEDYYESESGTT